LILGGFKAVGVLAASGEAAEVYDLGAGLFRPVTSGASASPRVYHSATLLDNGDILAVGGVVDNAGTVSGGAQVFTPGTEALRDTSGSLALARFGHSATVLIDGTVLVAGGLSGALAPVIDAERYVPLGL